MWLSLGREGTLVFLLHKSPKFYNNVSYSLAFKRFNEFLFVGSLIYRLLSYPFRSLCWYYYVFNNFFKVTFCYYYNYNSYLIFFQNRTFVGEWSNFRVGNGPTYTLGVHGYKGNIGDSLR